MLFLLFFNTTIANVPATTWLQINLKIRAIQRQNINSY